MVEQVQHCFANRNYSAEKKSFAKTKDEMNFSFSFLPKTIFVAEKNSRQFAWLNLFCLTFRKSEKSGSSTRETSLPRMIPSGDSSSKRLGSLPVERKPSNAKQRRSRFDAGSTLSQESFRSVDENATSNLMSTSLSDALETEIGSQKNRFFSLSRRFRFRTESPEKTASPAPPPPSATVHFLDQDIDLETKEPTTKKSEQRPSKGILKSLRHRSPFRFRSKETSSVEQQENKSQSNRGRTVESKKSLFSSNNENSNSTLFRRNSGLKDLIHKFEPTSSNDRTAKTKRVTIDDQPNKMNSDEIETSFNDRNRTGTFNSNNRSKTVDIPDLLRNVEKETTTNVNKPILRHSNSSRQTTSFDSTNSMVSATDSIGTTSSLTRKPTSTARPLMLSVVSSDFSFQTTIRWAR